MIRKPRLWPAVVWCVLTTSVCAYASPQQPAPQKPAPPASAAKPAPAPAGQAKKGAWLDRGYLSVNGIFQTATPSFTQTQSWPYFAETATATIQYPGKSAPGVDIAGGWRLWQNLAVGAGLAVVSRPATTVVTGSLPNPLYVGKPTTLSGGFEADHSEAAIHVQASWTIPLRPKMLLMVFGGPSFVNVTQTLVQAEGIGASRVYPYDDGKVTSANTTNQSKMALGFSAGADFTYRLSKTIGVGGIIRYAVASADFPVTNQPSVPVAAGGLEVGGGLRVLFPPSKSPKTAAPGKPQSKPATPAKRE
jgi:hypothetical protein